MTIPDKGMQVGCTECSKCYSKYIYITGSESEYSEHYGKTLNYQVYVCDKCKFRWRVGGEEAEKAIMDLVIREKAEQIVEEAVCAMRHNLSIFFNECKISNEEQTLKYLVFLALYDPTKDDPAPVGECPENKRNMLIHTVMKGLSVCAHRGFQL